MGGAQAWHQGAGRSTQGKRPGVPSRPVHAGGVLVPPSSLGWSSCQLPRQAGTPQTLTREAGLARVCVARPRVLRRALGQAGPQPTVRAQARPPGRAGRPGLAPWRPQRLAPGALLGARSCPRLGPAGHGAAPAAGRHAHATLSPLLAVRLALRPLVPVAGPAGLGRDGAEQVVPGAQEVALAGQAEAALAQRHAGGRVAGRPRPVVVLELGQVGRVAVGDELRGEGGQRGARLSGGGAPGAARAAATTRPLTWHCCCSFLVGRPTM